MLLEGVGAAVAGGHSAKRPVEVGVVHQLTRPPVAHGVFSTIRLDVGVPWTPFEQCTSRRSRPRPVEALFCAWTRSFRSSCDRVPLTKRPVRVATTVPRIAIV